MNCKILVALALVASVFVSLADGAAKPKRTPLTPAERLARTGGMIEKPGSQKGKIAFIDTQSTLAAENIQKIVNELAKESGLNFVYEKAAPADCPCSLKDASKADFAVVITDDPKKPTSVVSPDDHWALVNIACLDKNLKTEEAKKKFFEGRCRRQILRIYTIAAGGWASAYPGNITAPQNVEDLDLVGEFIPEDVKDRNRKFFRTFGITSKVVSTYLKACREGWAPAPTNDIQKAIWDKVHELPSNPVKIEFDPKKDK